MCFRSLARTILVSTVLCWTVQPSVLRGLDFVDTSDLISIELDNEVDADQFETSGVDDCEARFAVLIFSAVHDADGSTLVRRLIANSRRHLRGPPAG